MKLSNNKPLFAFQIKSVVNTSVDVLAKHFGLKPWQNHELHERVTSQVRAKLKYEDLDNKDARLRILEEKIEMDIKHLKLTAKQVWQISSSLIIIINHQKSSSSSLQAFSLCFGDCFLFAPKHCIGFCQSKFNWIIVSHFVMNWKDTRKLFLYN